MKDREGQINSWLGLCRNYSVSGRGDKKDLALAACFFHKEMLESMSKENSKRLKLDRALVALEEKKIELRQVRQESYDLRVRVRDYESRDEMEPSSSKRRSSSRE